MNQQYPATVLGMVSETDFALATLADEPVLRGLMGEFYAHEGLVFDEERTLGAFRTLAADPNLGRIWIFRVDGEPVGYVAVTVCFSLEFAGRYALIDELYVREAHRGRGIGARALEVAAQACRELDVSALRLEVDTWNTRAMDLYRRLGFTLQERHMMSRWIA
jgi:ribosomal protein S18 acetylase RimI-like enzyme